MPNTDRVPVPLLDEEGREKNGLLLGIYRHTGRRAVDLLQSPDKKKITIYRCCLFLPLTVMSIVGALTFGWNLFLGCSSSL